LVIGPAGRRPAAHRGSEYNPELPGCQILRRAGGQNQGERELPMRFLIKLMRGLHLTIGISTPPPEQERFYVFVWLAIGVVMVLFFLVMLWVMQ
jgi:hypothetical protein